MKILTLEELTRIPLDPSAIAKVPQSVAQDSCVLPVSWDGSRLHLIVRTDAGIAGDPTFERLNYILKCDYTYDFATVDDLRGMVDAFYQRAYAEIQNCARLRYRCPKKFAQLAATEDPLVRFCGECHESVYFCRNDDELLAHSNKGHCVAFHENQQEFMGLSND